MKFADPIYLILGACVVVALVVLRIWLTQRNSRELSKFAANRLIPQLPKESLSPDVVSSQRSLF